MNCRTALELLECATLCAMPAEASGSERSDCCADEVAAAEMVAAREHLDGCPRCRDAFHAMQERDRQIARAMRDVLVPEGLRDRLLEALAIRSTDAVQAGPQHPATTQPEETPRTLPRRRLFRSAAAIAAAIALATGIGIWWLSRGPEQFTVAEWNADAAMEDEQLASLEPFDNSFGALSPASWAGAPVSFSKPRGIAHPKIEGHVAAAYAFRLQTRGGPPITGIIVAIPKSRISSPPASTRFEFRPPRAYTDAGGVVMVAWTEGDLVYVCGVRGGAQQAQLLEAALYGPVA